MKFKFFLLIFEILFIGNVMGDTVCDPFVQFSTCSGIILNSTNVFSDTECLNFCSGKGVGCCAYNTLSGSCDFYDGPAFGTGNPEDLSSECHDECRGQFDGALCTNGICVREVCDVDEVARENGNYAPDCVDGSNLYDLTPARCDNNANRGFVAKIDPSGSFYTKGRIGEYCGCENGTTYNDSRIFLGDEVLYIDSYRVNYVSVDGYCQAAKGYRKASKVILVKDSLKSCKCYRNFGCENETCVLVGGLVVGICQLLVLHR